MRVMRVDGVGKRYRIGQRTGYKTFRESLANAMRRPFQMVASAIRRDRSWGAPDSAIWALKDISFEVAAGEVVGIIGSNGAGKTTLLKILCRITEPSAGYAELRGRVGALLEVGTGFHPELTGRENIYLSAAILGLRRSEIGSKFDEIVEFSGVESFIDTPVKHYSSGMYLRLAFAVAAHLEPDILVVDEVLAVGDAAFQGKCLGKMRGVAHSGRTVLFVSHNMGAIRGLCSRVLVLDGGRLKADGSVDAGIRTYLSARERSGDAQRVDLVPEDRRAGSGNVRIRSFSARAAGGGNGELRTGEDAEFLIEYAARRDRPLLRIHAAVGVMDALGNSLFGCTTRMMAQGDFRDLPPTGTIVCRIKSLPLIPGEYRVRLLLKDDAGLADEVDGVAGFAVREGGDNGLMVTPSRAWGNFAVQHTWDWISAGGHGGTVGDPHPHRTGTL